MPTYRVEWTREQWFYVNIEANTEQDAIHKFWDGDYENEQMFGSEIQDSVVAHKIEETN